ncbi:MAG: TIGR03067 domain-containing protein, partial [Gemmataceae bacterium]
LQERTLMTRAFTAAFLLAAGLALAADALAPFQGKWDLTSSEKDGKALPAGSVRTVTGDAYVIERDGKTLGKGTLKVDPSATPKAIDITRAGGKPMLGIYTLDGDVQKVCIAPEGKDRPTEFTSKDGHTLSEWKKAK